MSTAQLTYIRAHGRHLRWMLAELRRAGITVDRVERAIGREFFIIARASEEAVNAALENVRGYKPRKRKALDLQVFDGMLLAGLVVAGAVALVTPLGGGVVLALLAILRWAYANMHVHAKELFDLGGKWRVGAVVGVAFVFCVVAGFLVAAGTLAGVEIAAGNSALSLVGGW